MGRKRCPGLDAHEAEKSRKEFGESLEAIDGCGSTQNRDESWSLWLAGILGFVGDLGRLGFEPSKMCLKTLKL